MSDASLTESADSRSPLDRAANSAAGPGGWFAGLARRWHTLDNLLGGLGDWLNPIVVKETRQALRSWQFALTFILLLVACWIVTIGGVAVIGPSIYYAAGGGELLRAYYFILSLPLLVVVPFAAFRSLASEREDNTYDLLSITTLRPRQIISGKLASAVLQMIVFFSAITPCLAFTYLLRGVDAPTIAILLAYTFLTSLALSMLGLLLATLSRQRYGQMVMSVGFVATLLYCFGIAQAGASELIRYGFMLYIEHDFWIANLFGIALYATTFLLTFLAAAAMITSPAENRSTPLRVAMLAVQAAGIGWLSYFVIEADYDSFFLLALAIVAGCYWYAMGTMLDGEQAEMSRRAQRSLPQSFLGRVFFTWFQPGPASGYMFAVANLTAVFLLCLLPSIFLIHPTTAQTTWLTAERLFYLLLIGWSYVVVYLGLGRLLVALLRKFTDVTMFASVLLHLLLVLAGSGIPTSIQRMSVSLQNIPYSYLQITNPLWTLAYLLEYSPAPEEAVLAIVLPATAICVLVLNLPGVVRELQRVRSALPSRIAADEAELHPAAESLPQSPWDEN